MCMNQRHTIIVEPIIKVKNFQYLFFAYENSWTNISEQAIYTKVPPAKLSMIELTRSGASLRPRPIASPPDSKSERPTILRIMAVLDLFFDFARDIPYDKHTITWWILMPIMRLMKTERSFMRPSAIPSNTEWNPRAISKTRGVKLMPHTITYFSSGRWLCSTVWWCKSSGSSSSCTCLTSWHWS